MRAGYFTCHSVTVYLFCFRVIPYVTLIIMILFNYFIQYEYVLIFH